MSQAKKFGAFAGVYTPSLLTILGVIMYMRLGWIVGNGGLYNILGIIIISHIISFTTGLSISSIATDKKIKTGGIYYMLSRSLGLPMGGAIGIALAIGTALSISLYIIGFAESFLSIQVISDFLHLSPSTTSYSIIGSVIIILLVIIAFISTSLAIKTQFFILIAILLSLVSIIGGFYFYPEFRPESPLLIASKGSESLETLFAIFFPAVTGFTAGVAMSGDLKNPKKDIPLGTMAAIASGFVVYILLAIGFSFFVKSDLLLNHPDFLIQIAWIPGLIFLGIWGATLSSALGGILGGPRIFQAIAKDGILPKFLAKTHGESEEPRNALILIFIIAEIGILIGELNVIAGIVSMFYLASYGFINMAFTLENWASTDFSPSFKIPKFVGIIGFIASFTVMFRLDPGSMVIAFVIMWAIFFILKRKELRLDFGDVWQSVWSGVIRKALHRLDQQEIEERNWRPNVLLFSGGTNKRKYLLEIGKAIVGRHGLLSNFDLIEKENSSYLFAKHEQSIGTNVSEGIFTRRHSVRDIYEGIELLSATYGFSGIEPNTVLLGWSRQSKNPIRSVKLLHRLNNLDLNVLLVDYDKNRGFGKYKRIDIWWQDKSNHGNLSLKLAKFIYNSPNWNRAQIRLQVINSTNQNADLIRVNTQKIFEELRINAELRIINNEIEQKEFYDIIKAESANADLIFIGTPQLFEGKELEYFDKINQLLPEIGTAILVSAASKFKAYTLGTENKAISYKKQIESFTPSNKGIKWPENILLAQNLNTYLVELQKIEINYSSDIIAANKEIHEQFEKINQIVLSQLNEAVNFIDKSKGNIPFSYLYKNAQATLNKTLIRIEEINETSLDSLENKIENINKKWLSDYQDILQKQPSNLNLIYSIDTVNKIINTSKNNQEIKFAKKIRRQIKIFGRPYTQNLKFANSLKKYHENELYTAKMQFQNFAAKAYLKEWLEIKNTVQNFNNKLLSLKFLNSQTNNFEKTWNEIKNEITDSIKRNESNINDLNTKFSNYAQNKLNANFQIFINKINLLKKPSALIKTKDKKRTNNLKYKILNTGNYWKRNHALMSKNLKYELLFDRIKNIHAKNELDIKAAFENQVIKKQSHSNYISFSELKKLSSQQNWEQIAKTELKLKDNYIIESEIYDFTQKLLENSAKRIKKETSRFPESDQLINAEHFNELTEHLFTPIDSITVKSSSLVNYIIEEGYIEELHKELKQISDILINNFKIINDTIQIIPYSFRGINEDSVNKHFEEFIVLQETKLKDIEKSNQQELEKFSQFTTQLSTTINNQLSTFHFISIAENYKQYLREQVGKKGWQKLKLKFKNIQIHFVSFFNKVLYQRSNAVLFAKKLNTINLSEKNKVSEFLKLANILKIKADVEDKIPFYYKQLFLNKNNFLNDLWEGRNKEINELKTALINYKQGYTGAFLILGEYNSGKSFMAQYFASNIIKSNNIFTIEAPIGGSIELQVLENKIKEAVGINVNEKSIWQQIPQNSTIIFENIELWWQRSEQGYLLIEKIHQWLNKYSKKIYFILTCNTHSYQFMDKVLQLDNNYLHIFQTPPVSAEMLKNIILKRHNASGLEYSFKETKLFKGFETAQFFNQLFNVSQGIIGDALILWLSSIQEIENKELLLKSPEKPNLQILDKLSDKEWTLIIQFLIHRELTVKKIKGLFNNQKEIFEHLPFLLRSGILISNNPNVYKLNPMLYPFIKVKLFEKEII